VFSAENRISWVQTSFLVNLSAGSTVLDRQMVQTKFLLLVVALSFWVGESSGAPTRISESVSEEIRFQVGRFTVVSELVLPGIVQTYPVIVYFWGSGPTDRKSFLKSSLLLKTLLKAGFAVFVNDKPGSRESRGEFSAGRLLHERAMILTHEIELLKKHPAIDSQRIGVFGGSQAGYVMPLAILTTRSAPFRKSTTI
jgi:dipeptidyl aminopeptidase/acylaminoacyl peptidase